MASPGSIALITPAGQSLLDALAGETVSECLWRHRIPISAVHVYVLSDGNSARLSPSSLLAEHLAHGDVLAYAIRNIDFARLTQAAPSVQPKLDSLVEWLSAAGSSEEPAHAFASLSLEAIVGLARRSVTASLSTIQGIEHLPVVVGVSGGGDSNLLLTAALQLPGLNPALMHPVMVLGIPEWDHQLPNARAHAQHQGVDLTVIDADEAASLLHLDSVAATVSRFRAEFGNTSIEFFGTWYLRRVLSEYSATQGTHVILLGGNREDVLAEALFLLTSGRRPLPFPVRSVGDMQLVYGLYQLPKKVIDAAYPRFALDNYRSRGPGRDYGRSGFYYLVHLIQDTLPGLDVSLLSGLSAIASNAPQTWMPDLADYTVGTPEPALKERWLRVLGRAPLPGESE